MLKIRSVVVILAIIVVSVDGWDWWDKVVEGITTTPKPTLPPVEPTNGCGHTFKPPSRWRVVNGKTAQQNSFPWLVPISKGGSHKCGGNIINRRWLVTAAHCVFDIDPFLLRLAPGDYKLNVLSDSRGSQTQYMAHKTYPHPKYVGKADGYRNDIALIQLKNDLKYSESVQPICLPKKGQNFEKNRMCFTAGWGDVKDTTKEKTTLQYLHDRIMPINQCKKKWNKEIAGKMAATNDHVCFGNGDPSPCQGDSGGGLLCKDGIHWRVAGVLSYVVNGCMKEGYPAIYVRVSSYLDWINKTIKDNS